MDVPDDESERILTSLGFGVRTLGGWQAAQPGRGDADRAAGHGWQVTVPGWRVDVQRPVDLIEEVGRHYGFEHLPTTFPAVEQPPPPSDPRIARDARVRRALLGDGLQRGDHVRVHRHRRGRAVRWRRWRRWRSRIRCPRNSRRCGRACCRAWSTRSATTGGTAGATCGCSRSARASRARGETRGAAVAWTGLATPEHWSGGRRDVDFFDVKGVAEQLCARDGRHAGVRRRRASVSSSMGRAAEVRVDGTVVGVVGQLDPAIAEARDLPAATPCTSSRSTSTRSRRARRPSDALRDSRCRGIRRSCATSSILSTTPCLPRPFVARFARRAPPTLVDVREFDRYQGKGIPDGKVSLALRLTFQAPDRTLDRRRSARGDGRDRRGAHTRARAPIQTIAVITWPSDDDQDRRSHRPSNRSIGSKKKSSCSSASSDGCAASSRASWKTTPGCSASSRRSRRA